MMRRGLLIIAATLVGASIANAHHSFPAMYDLNKEVTIKGPIVAFLLRNPHTIIQVMAPGEDHKMYRWAIEWAAAGALTRNNSGVGTLKSGDIVIIHGSPGRNSTDHKLRLNSIERPSDGWKWGGKFD
jgi:hypothetical protein